MSIQEALKRESVTLKEPATIPEVIRSTGEYYQPAFKALDNSNSFGLLKELKDAIAQTYPDVEYGGPSLIHGEKNEYSDGTVFYKMPNGLIEISLVWNKVIHLQAEGYGNYIKSNRLSIVATREERLLFLGEAPYILNKDDYSNSTLVEDTLIEIYRHPQVNPPVNS